jgi:hypothetical protein
VTNSIEGTKGPIVDFLVDLGEYISPITIAHPRGEQGDPNIFGKKGAFGEAHNEGDMKLNE